MPIIHIIPLNDLKDHIDSSTCECNPKSEILDNGDIMIIHNSYDKREVIEQLTEDIILN